MKLFNEIYCKINGLPIPKVLKQGPSLPELNVQGGRWVKELYKMVKTDGQTDGLKNTGVQDEFRMK